MKVCFWLKVLLIIISSIELFNASKKLKEYKWYCLNLKKKRVVTLILIFSW